MEFLAWHLDARLHYPQVIFHHAPLTLATIRRAGFISAWDCRWHLSPSVHRAVLLRLGAALAAQGVLISSPGHLEQPGGTPIPRWASRSPGLHVYFILQRQASLKDGEKSSHDQGSERL